MQQINLEMYVIQTIAESLIHLKAMSLFNFVDIFSEVALHPIQTNKEELLCKVKEMGT